MSETENLGLVLGRLYDEISGRLGIDVRRHRPAVVETEVRDRARRAGLDPAEYASRAVEDPAELVWLAGKVAVGETYFYRHPAQIELLEELLGGPLAGRRKLRIWAAGCATGEEAYTAAIVARKAAPARKLTVLGTDIHEGALDVAREGVYRGRALKKVPSALMDRFFEDLGGGAARVSGELRNAARFRVHNLFRDPYPAGWDVILCRNVLIYFSLQIAGKVFNLLLGALRPGGCLILGPAEAANRSGAQATWNSAGTAFAYRRPPVETLLTTAPVISKPAVPTPSEAPPPEPAQPQPTLPEPALPEVSPEATPVAEDGVAEAVKLMEEGSLEEALKLLRREVYLRPEDPVAHLQLGFVWRKLGHEAPAARHVSFARKVVDEESKEYESRLVRALAEQSSKGA